MIGYVVALTIGGVLIGTLGPAAVGRWIPEADAPVWSWVAATTAPPVALVVGLLMLPLFGRAGGWILAVGAAATVVWRTTVPSLVDVLKTRTAEGTQAEAS